MTMTSTRYDRHRRAEYVELRLDRHGHRPRHYTPQRFDDSDPADQDTERRDHAECELAFVDAPEDEALHGKTDKAREQDAPEQAEPQTARCHAHRIRDIGARASSRAVDRD